MTRRSLLLAAPALIGAGCLLVPSSAPAVTHEVLTVDGARVHFTRMGSGPPVVLIHGASGSIRDWTFRHAAMLAETHTVLIFDRPGSGASDPAPEPTLLSSQAAVLRAALAQLGFTKAHAVGHSYGGAVALAWALDAPETVSGLLLLGAPSHVWPGSPGPLYDLTNTPVVGWAFSRIVRYAATDSRISGAVDTIFAPQPVPDGFVAHVEPRRTVHPLTYRRNAAQIGALKDQLREMTPRYPGLTMPIELIHGEADTIVWATIHSGPFAEAVASANFTPLPGVGHMPHHADPEAFMAAFHRLA